MWGLPRRDEQQSPAEHKRKSEASGRYRSHECADCQRISLGGRCRDPRSPRFDMIVFGREACEGFEK